MNRSLNICILLLLSFILVAFLRSDGSAKKESFRKVSASFSVQTGLAEVCADSSRPAQFIGHYLQGSLFPNTLYQAFLAIHYDELDSVLTHHGSAGRTISGKYPGDSNTLKYLPPFSVVRNTRIDSISLRFTIPGVSSPVQIQQNLYSYKDSSYRIFLDYIITSFPRTQPDTVRLSNMYILLGYDGDIGSTLSGYLNDSCGYYRDDSARFIYVYDRPDSTKSVYAGIQLIKGGLSDSAGNRSMFHQTINAYGSSMRRLDSLLYQSMIHPQFNPSQQKTDQWIYWSVYLGDRFTLLATDTIHDTLKFAFINGFSRQGLIATAKGYKVPVPPTIDPPATIPVQTALKNNYPNPFNASTQILFDLSSGSEVTIDIYNVLGQKVRNLIRNYFEPGSYSVLWDGKGDNGKPLGSGLYFYRLTTDRFQSTKKCLMVK